ncbi:MAG: GNAT family N-acetyltransferase [Desulfosarcinaceae bacterium]
MSDISTSIISAETYEQLWRQKDSGLNWDCLFVLPFWLETVCRHLGAPGEPYRVAVWEDGQVVGVAPLALEGGVARFLGRPSVCDYQDIVVRRGYAGKVVGALLEHLAEHEVHRLELQTLHPGASLLKGLEAPSLRPSLSAMHLEAEDVTFETGLPATWEEYLLQLDGKQRHEVRRKMRRLEAAGPVGFDLAANNGRIPQAAETFLNLFRLNRQDKMAFMDQTMEAYFRDLIQVLARQELLRLYTMRVSGQDAAAVLCFDYQGVRYLYNSGYDERYKALSVGVLCKIFSIREGIEMGCRHYDFLKGPEIYKRRIGGKEVGLFSCLLEF